MSTTLAEKPLPVATPPRVSFKQLMDEELAKKMQEEEEHALKETSTKDNASAQAEGVVNDGEFEYYDEEDFEDYVFYDDVDEEAPTAEESDEGASSPVPDEDVAVPTEDNTPVTTEMTDEQLARILAEEEDYLAALALQNQMDAQSQQRYTRVSGDPHGNVRSFAVHEYFPPPIKRTDQEDAGYELDPYAVPHPIKAASANSTPGKKKKKGVSSGPTKHDKEATWAYNAQNLSKFMDSNITDKTMRIPSRVYNQLKLHSRKQEDNRIRFKSKEDHASFEQALDPRTRILLYKMLNSGIFEEINGVVNTGKEANVYHATGANLIPSDDEVMSYQERRMRKSLIGGEYAVKIFKTTLNEFKNREEYIEGDYRFRNDKFSHQNPRKIIKLWAQKEMRNLKRMRTVGLSCPLPVLLREHILVMTFIGKDSVGAPHLSDIKVPLEQWVTISHDIFKMMRTMYQNARLVHADLSAFNILWFDGQPHIIDVSQAVEYDHPNSMEFLRRDCYNMSKFFKSRGHTYCLTPRQLFDFVTDKALPSVEQYITTTEDGNMANPIPTVEEQIEAEVFLKSYIPRTLSAIRNPHELAGRESDVFHMSVTGLNNLPTEKLEEDPLTDSDRCDSECDD